MRILLLFISILMIATGCDQASIEPSTNGNEIEQPNDVLAENTEGNPEIIADGPLVESLMNEQKFWSIIAKSITDAEVSGDQLESIRTQLLKFSPEEILEFELRTQQLLYSSYSSKLMCAGELLHMNCPAFHFEDFRCWILLQGQKVFNDAKADPNSLVLLFGPEQDCYASNNFHSLASATFTEIAGHALADSIDHEHFAYSPKHYPTLNHTWSLDRPTSMRSVCPGLYAACYH